MIKEIKPSMIFPLREIGKKFKIKNVKNGYIIFHDFKYGIRNRFRLNESENVFDISYLSKFKWNDDDSKSVEIISNEALDCILIEILEE